MTMNLDVALSWLEVDSVEELDPIILKKIYRKLAQRYHPDKGGKAEDFVMLKAAYTLVSEKIRPHKNTTKENYESSNYHSQSEQSSNQYNQTWHDMEFYKTQYQNTASSLQKFQKIVNSQVDIIREFQNNFNNFNNEYQTFGQNLEARLQSELKLLEKKYIGKWWQNIIGNSMTKNEYIIRQNKLIDEYNSTVQNSKEKYNNDVLDSYESVINSIIKSLN
jgi:DnaJ-class molecular chaperone